MRAQYEAYGFLTSEVVVAEARAVAETVALAS